MAFVRAFCGRSAAYPGKKSPTKLQGATNGPNYPLVECSTDARRLPRGYVALDLMEELVLLAEGVVPSSLIGH